MEVVGCTTLQCEWKRDGQQVGPSATHTITAKESVLTIATIDAKDAGKYTCHGVSPDGRKTSVSIDVAVTGTLINFIE